MSSSMQLAPTYHGFIASTYDALILFEACLSGQINHVARRPHDRERDHVIKSGNIFIYEEHSSGIKRWTDGVSWSPSRILGNFLIYRQLVKPFGPGEKKKALKKNKSPTGVVKNVAVNTRAKNSVQQMFGNPAASSGIYDNSGQLNLDVERSLIGSLVDSYDFMDDGLVKKTISVTVGDVTHHLVSYYNMADAMATNKFIVPSKDPQFHNMQIRPTLLKKQNFRAPIEDIDPMERASYERPSYGMVNQSMAHSSSYSGPESHGSYQAAPIYHSYHPTPISESFDHSVPAYSPASHYPATTHTQYAPAPGIYPAPMRTDHFPPPTDYRHRYSIVSATSSDGSRAQMPSSIGNDRRSSMYRPSISSEDSGIGMHMDTQSRSSNESGYSGSSHYYTSSASSRDPNPANQLTPLTSQKHHSSPDSRGPSQMSYDKGPVNPTYRVAMDSKDNGLWPMTGSAAVGHAHYQPQWASASH